MRADSGFAAAKPYSYLEAEGIEYTIGLASNARLQDLAAPQLAEAQSRYDIAAAQEGQKADGDGDQKVRLVGQGRYPGPTAGSASGAWCSRRRCSAQGA